MATKCDHPNLTVRQDPSDQDKEILSCPDCKTEKTRVSAAASMKQATAQRLTEVERLWAEGFEGLGARVKQLEADVTGLGERLAKLEAFGGAT